MEIGTIGLLAVVATDAIFIEYRLNFGKEGKGAFRAVEGLQIHGGQRARDRVDGRGNVVLGFMATDAALVFAGHTDKPRAHQLNRRAILVERLDEDGGVRRNLEGRASILVNRRVAEEAATVPAAF